MPGFRRCLVVAGQTPIVVVNVLLPAIAIYRGDLQSPAVLLSDLHSHENPAYEGTLTFPWFLCLLSAAFIFVEYPEYLREKASSRAALFGGMCAVIMWAWVIPSFLMVILTKFDEKQKLAESEQLSAPKDVTSFLASQSWTWILHCFGATALFFGMAVIAGLYLRYIHPDVLKVEPKSALYSKAIGALGVATSSFVAGIVRYLHLTHDKYLWAYPLLALEILILNCAAFGLGFGFLPIMDTLDEEKPIFNFPQDLYKFIKSINASDLKSE